MLRALRQLLRPGGRIAYTTIFVAPDLTPAQRRRAQRSGPRAVASRGNQQQLLLSAGYVDVAMTDLTSEFATTARAWLDAWVANMDELTAFQPREAIVQRLRDERAQERAINDGLLRRGLFSASNRGGADD